MIIHPMLTAARKNAMRLLLLLTLFIACYVHVQAQNGVLDRKITLQVKDAPLIDVLKKIRTLANIRLNYNTDLILKQPPVTVSVKDTRLSELLQTILRNTNLQYLVEGDLITLQPGTTKKGPVRVQQGYQVSGQVVDKAAKPLRDVTVQSSLMIVRTDATGTFSLFSKEKEQLRFSCIGMRPITAAVDLSDFMMVVMDTMAQEIQEVIVTGYQVIDKRMSTAAAVTLKASEVIQPGEPTIDKMLQGKVPGLMVINNSGSVNAPPKLRMRGTATFLGNASPIWVIDGVIRQDPVDLTPAQINDAIGGAEGANYSIIGNGISGLNPYDIESMTFLKDAAATAIYGIRAANGVIVITTKKGKSGPAQFSFTNNMRLGLRPHYGQFRLMNSKERIDVSRQVIEQGIRYPTMPLGISYEGLLQKLYAREISQEEFLSETNRLETINTDWFKELFRNAIGSQNSFSVSGGSGKTTYYASLNIGVNNGAAKKDANSLYGVTFNLQSALTKKLSLDLSVFSSYRKATGTYIVNPYTYALQTSRAIDPGEFYPKSRSFDVYGNQGAPLLYNVKNELQQEENVNNGTSGMLAAVLGYKIGYGFDWSAQASVQSESGESVQAAYDKSYMISNVRGWNYGDSVGEDNFKASVLPYGGVMDIQNYNMLALNMRNQLNYNRTFFNNRDFFTAFLGNEISSTQRREFASKELGYFPDRGQSFFISPYNTGSKTPRGFFAHSPLRTSNKGNYLAWYSAFTYSLKRRYTVSATLRTDGSNRFGQYSNARFLPNFGVSFGWNAGDEPWLENNRTISGLSFRASYGTQGNVVTAVGPNLIARYPAQPADPTTNEFILALKSLPYPNLRWEKTRQFNIGADFSLFNRRLNVKLETYYKESRDLIEERGIAAEFGMEKMYMNAGVMINRGYEVALNIVAVQTKDLSLSINTNFSRNFNDVKQSNNRLTYVNYLSGNAIVPGKPIGGMWSWQFNGLTQQAGVPTFRNTGVYKGLDADPAGFLVYSGRSIPLFFGGFSTTLRYKRITAASNFVYNIGAKKRLNALFTNASVSNGAPAPDLNLPVELSDRWRKPGDELHTNIPAIREYDFAGEMVVIPSSLIPLHPLQMWDQSDLRVVDANYLRCNSLSVYYALPERICKSLWLKSCNLGATASNLFIIKSADLRGQDPEMLNLGSTALPITRAYTFTLNLTF